MFIYIDNGNLNRASLVQVLGAFNLEAECGENESADVVGEEDAEIADHVVGSVGIERPDVVVTALQARQRRCNSERYVVINKT